MATTWMAGTLGAGARLRVQIAWGADIAAASTSWTWTDVTADVRQAGGQKITITVGRADEATTTQPAQCTLVLDNQAGAYSIGVQSSNWPNVRRNTPVRVQVDPSASGAAYTTIFLGYAVGFTPEWDSTGRDATVNLTVAGSLRRMAQGESPVQSSFRRKITASSTNVIGYWPCEDGPGAESIASGLVGGSPMVLSGVPNLAASNVFACSAPLPTFNGAEFLGELPSYTATNDIQVRFLIDVPAGGGTDISGIMRLGTTGSAPIWDLEYNTGGNIRLLAYNQIGTQVVNSGAVTFGIDGRRGQFGLQLTQNGANIDWDMDWLEIGATSGVVFTGTLAGNTLNSASYVQANLQQGNNESIAMGHILVQSVITSSVTNIVALNAHNGEVTTALAGAGRLTRLAAENSLPLTVVGDVSSTLVNQDSDKVGPQRVGTLLALLRECEAADGGTLHDGINDGLTYSTKRRRYNAAAAMTIAHTQLVMPFAPIDDDQRTRNKVTAVRQGGAEATFQDTTGPLGTTAIGTYDESVTVNAWKDAAALQYASWYVRRGTIEGYRYPNLSIDLARNPSLAASWLATYIGARIDVTGISTVRTQHPTGALSFILEGYTQTIDQFRWNIEANCSPFAPWRIIEVAADAGDTGEYRCHLESDGSTLATDEAIGSTSFSVATPSGPLWTTTADDVPMTIEVSGIPVTVTAISGAASPQTFTVTGSTVTKALLAGAAVTISNPPRLAL